MKTLPLDWHINLLLAIALLGFAATGLRATGFPQWRRPQRDGHSPETDLLQEWPKEGPNRLWQVTNIGLSFSTPSVVGDQIYLPGTEGLENESAIALTVKDGIPVRSAKLGKVGTQFQFSSF